MTKLVNFSSPIPLQVDLGHEKAQAMINLLKATPLPTNLPVLDSKPWALGIDLEFLKEAKAKFEQDWKLDALHEKINRWPNFIVHYDHKGCQAGGELHFVHARSSRADAVPLILMDGWPGKLKTGMIYIRDKGAL